MIYLPNFLLIIPRSPVGALGLPLALGILSGYRTAEIARSRWYQVSIQSTKIFTDACRQGTESSSRTTSKTSFRNRMANSVSV